MLPKEQITKFVLAVIVSFKPRGKSQSPKTEETLIGKLYHHSMLQDVN
jgi:hypothetical protein